MKGFKIKFKIADPPPAPQDLAVDTTAISPQPFSGPVKQPAMFQKKLTVRPLRAVPVPIEAPVPAPIERLPEVVAPAPAPAPEVVAPAPEPIARLPEVVPAPAPEPVQTPESNTNTESSLESNTNSESSLESNTNSESSVDSSNIEPPPDLQLLQDTIDDNEVTDTYANTNPKPFMPEDRKGFTKFIQTRYSEFKLDRLSKEINPDACSQMTLQTYKYQAFIREYMREASPYRGILVYHGLGSGKTCTSIAAAEALYGQGKRIIIMTPIALQENFINELMFCGFRHYRVKNKWVSFPLTPIVSTFAVNQVGLPEDYIKRVEKGDRARRVLWMPDLSVPESESNFDDLLDWERTMIRQQLYALIKNKFTFIGYTGMTQKALKEIAMTKPTFFDNSVIIIDEIHNLTRLMVGSLDKYLVEPKKASKTSKYEPVTVDTWEPKYKSGDPKDKYYNRAYLFYRLLTQAKNSKVIALSGTPIVNSAVELGILSNILHGYFHCVKDILRIKSDNEITSAKNILARHPYVNFYSLKKIEGGVELFFTILDEGYIKHFNGDVLEGIVNDDDAEPKTIEELYEEIKELFTNANLTLNKTPDYIALPLLPPTVEEFNDTFIDKDNFVLKNPVTFKKRISGLISYYRGSKEELMPMVTKDEIISCPFSALAFQQYATSRLKEIESEKTKKKPAIFDELEALGDSEAASYRFRSRALCNFAFPTDINRPFPGTKKGLQNEAGITKDVYGDGIEVEDLDKEEEEKDDSEGEGEGEEETYQQRLAKALSDLRERSSTIFKLSDAPDNELLRTYSAKYAEIYSHIMESKGSSLVYSNFKTVEGIGVFSMVLDANGFAPIKLVGSDENLKLSPETIESLTMNPGQPRYIFYSGSESIRVRQTLINLFNMRIDKLPSEIASIVRNSLLFDTKNFKGELCRVFMITGAGAEGLSLKNVRTVHIMEPYWNKVRTDQVKGRAVRICSHADLPYSKDPSENQRTVEVFTYVSTITPELLKTQQTLDFNDKGKSSDEYILQLATAKDKISSSFLTAIKAGAVDCQLNAFENENVTCFVQEGSVTDFMYDPRLLQDISSTEQTEKETVIKRKGYKIGGIVYVGVEKNGKTILYSITNTEMKEPLGELVDKKPIWLPGKEPKK